MFNEKLGDELLIEEEFTTLSKVNTRNYDIVAAIAGFIAGFAWIVGHFMMMRNEYLITLGSILVVTCLFYLFFRKKLLKSDDTTHLAGDSQSRILLINILFLLVFAASLYALQTGTLYRSPSYFLLTAVASMVVAIEIVLYSKSGGQIYLILGKILILALSLRCSYYFGYVGIVGVDPWTHHTIISDLLSQGHMQQFVSSSGKSNTYFNYPLFHLVTGMMSNIGALSIKNAMFLAAALPEVLSIIFLFLFGRDLIGVKGALLTALILGFSDFHIQWGTQIIPMTLGIALVSFVIYIVFSQKSWSRSIGMRFLLILLFAVIIQTHTVTTFVLFIALLAVFIARWVYRLLYRVNLQVVYVSLTMLLIFTIGFLAQWTYAAFGRSGFLDAIVVGLQTTFSQTDLLDRPEIVGALGDPLLYESILNISGFSILFGFAIIGIMLCLSNKYHDVARVSLITLAVGIFAIPFSFSLFGIRNVLPYRWFVFMYIPLTIFASFAIVKILDMYTRGLLRVLSIAIIFLVFSFLMITSTISNNDSPIYKKASTIRLAYTVQEMWAAKSLTQSYHGFIMADAYYPQAFNYFDYRADVSRLSQYWIDGELLEGIFVWRDSMSLGPILVSGKTSRDAWVILDEDYEQQLGVERQLIYSNTKVKAYLSR
ncbi:hypothetical protein ACFLVJ_01225 [Chloroflexota bacterium]